jgi:hypothetical protein
MAEMVIKIVEERHQSVFSRVAGPDEITACCKEFEEEFGKRFRLLPDGGLVPADVYIERVKMGKTSMFKPMIGWRGCPFCLTSFVATTQPVVITPAKE